MSAVDNLPALRHDDGMDESVSHELPSRVEALEYKLAFLEKTVDDLDGVVRDLFGRSQQLERLIGELRERTEQLVEALAEGTEPVPPT